MGGLGRSGKAVPLEAEKVALPLRCLKLDPSSRLLLAGGDDKSAFMWDTATGALLATWYSSQAAANVPEIISGVPCYPFFNISSLTCLFTYLVTCPRAVLLPFWYLVSNARAGMSVRWKGCAGRVRIVSLLKNVYFGIQFVRPCGHASMEDPASGLQAAVPKNKKSMTWMADWFFAAHALQRSRVLLSFAHGLLLSLHT